MRAPAQTLIFVLLAACPLAAAPVQAQPALSEAEGLPPGPSHTWHASAELGYTLATGSTESQSLAGKAQGSLEHGPWLHETNFEANFTRSSVEVSNPAPPPVTLAAKQTTARRYLAKGKSNYSISRRHYVFATGQYENDAFSGFAWRASEFGGYGIKVLDGEKVKLKLEGGGGGRHFRRDLESDARGEGVGRGALGFLWRIGEGAKFTEDATLIAGGKEGGGVVTESVTALSAAVNKLLALKISFTLQHTSEPPAGKKEVDTRTQVTLVFTFN